MPWLLNRLLALGVGLALTGAILVLAGLYGGAQPKHATKLNPPQEITINLSQTTRTPLVGSRKVP